MFKRDLKNLLSILPNKTIFLKEIEQFIFLLTDPSKFLIYAMSYYGIKKILIIFSELQTIINTYLN